LVHLLPGILLGQALALAGDLSGRLLVILLVLLTVLAIAGWLVRIVAGSLTPYRKAIQGRLANWARRQGNRPMRRFARAIAPENPRSVLIVLSAVLGLGALAILIDLVSGRVLRSAAGNFDSSLFNLFSELRSAPADELFIRLTMLGDDFVIYATAAAMILWLVVRRAWRAALAIGLAVAAGKLVYWASHFIVARQLPPNVSGTFNADSFYFPSSHSLMIGLLVGLLAVLCNRGMARWTRALVVACGALVVIAVAFSRLYLGVNWLGDVLAGLLIAAVLSTIYGVATQALPAQRIRPFSLVAVSSFVFIMAGALHISLDYNRTEHLYAARDKMLTVSLVDWPQSGWTKVASRRIDLAGVPEEQFVGQWLGSLETLQTAVQASNFMVIPNWTWKDSFAYLDPHAPLALQRPRPALHEGLKAKLTAVLTPTDGSNYRLTLRAFKANALTISQGSSPVYLLSLTHEVPKPHLKLFAVPSDLPPTLEEATSFLTQLRAAPNVDVVAEKTVEGQPVDILKPKL
jgi:membrane-associated phospholipid phosphatase